jgi:L-alanine-DL-glutamate epimerase-like enolase superfamily enzyme
MRIKRVDAFLLSYPLPEPLHLQYYGGHRVIYKRDAMLIRVETENGIVGYAPGQGSEKSQREIQDIIGPFLQGRTLADPDALRVQFLSHSDSGLLKTYATVEIALYDALGKLRNCPISELLGGRVRDRIRLYGSGGMYMPPEGYAHEIRVVADLGFKAYKMRPGMGPDEDLDAIRLMREAAGPDMDIMVDAHTWWRMGNRSYDMETIARLAEQMAEYDIYWLEEPVRPDSHDSLRHLKEWDIVPIAAGEHESDEEGFADLISRQCVDFVQMDVVCQGGYGVAKRLFAEIHKNQLKFAFHSWGTELEVIAAAQVGICWPESVVEWLEYPCHRYLQNGTLLRDGMYPFDLATEILKTKPVIENGEMIVPSGEGLGVEVDETVISRYPWIPGPWSRFTLIDPPATYAVSGDHTQQWDGK